MFVCLLGGNEGPNSIFEVIHEVEISHGQKTLGIILAAILWNPDPVDEVHNCSKDTLRALVHFEDLVVCPDCGVQGCLEVLRPAEKI